MTVAVVVTETVTLGALTVVVVVGVVVWSQQGRGNRGNGWK